MDKSASKNRAWWLGGLALVMVMQGCGVSTQSMSTLSTPMATPFLCNTPDFPTPTTTPRTGLNVVSMEISPKDGMALVSVPEGEFLMGSTGADNYAFDNEKPQHVVYLDAFWIDQTEVTQGMYTKCSAAGCVKPLCPSGNENDPIINVTWDNAQAYCAWAGRRLPTEAEWEKAARGPNGLIYPWGDTAPDAATANFSRNVDWTAQVGSYSADTSPYGALDMAGNVREWVADWYEPFSSGRQVNPTGPGSGESRVLRGGSWSNNAVALRTAYRFYGNPSRGHSLDIGFRCAVSGDK